MSKKVVLLGLTACEVMAASIATVFVSKENTQAFAGENTPTDYSVTIDSTHKLIKCGITNGRAFRLSTGEYGYLGMGSDASSWLNDSPDGDYADYAFSWSPNIESRYSFDIILSSYTTSGYIDGKRAYFRGFPGAYEITTVYTTSAADKDFEDCEPGDGWVLDSKTTQGNLVTEVAKKQPGKSSYAYAMDWILTKPGTVYIKSITLKYTCPVA